MSFVKAEFRQRAHRLGMSNGGGIDTVEQRFVAIAGKESDEIDKVGGLLHDRAARSRLVPPIELSCVFVRHVVPCVDAGRRQAVLAEHIANLEDGFIVA